MSATETAPRRVALLVPCYVDQCYPEVAAATRRLLESQGCAVAAPRGQTCCGQPLMNAGFADRAAAIARHCRDVFQGHDAVVCPSGSCTAMLREHYADLGVPTADMPPVYELCEYLHDVLGAADFPVSFPHRVGVHHGCHGLRELRLAQPSESLGDAPDKMRALLARVRGIELVDIGRPDECCGFGGLFSVSEEAVSVGMGRARLETHARAEVEVIVSGDMSCLMHLDGLLRREGRAMRVAHVAQVLAGTA